MHRLNSDGSITDAANVSGNQCEYGGLTRGNFQAFLSREPVANRQSAGWYASIVEGDVAQPTAAPEQDAIIVPRPVPAPPAPDPTAALYPDGIETPVLVLTSQSAGYGIGVIATDTGDLATYIDHQFPRPDAAEIKRRIQVAVEEKQAQSDAYLTLLDALASGNSASVKTAATAARDKHKVLTESAKGV